MMKKVKKLIRNTLIGLIWSYLFISLFKICLIYFWNFNPFSSSSWIVVEQFWNAGGNISSGRDYLLLFLLISFFPLWILGWRSLCKKDYIKLLMAPFEAYHKRVLSKYSADGPRIVLKNLGVKEAKLEEQIEARYKKTEERATDEEVNSIRSALQEKLSSLEKK